MKKFIVFLLGLLTAATVIGLVYTKNFPDPQRMFGQKTKPEKKVPSRGNES